MKCHAPESLNLEGNLLSGCLLASTQAEYGEQAFQAQVRAPQLPSASGDPNAIPLGQRAVPVQPKKAPLEPIPDVEWWDRPLLLKGSEQGGAAAAGAPSYGEDDEQTLASLNLTAITQYVQHPVPIEPPADEAPPEAMPLMLTKKVGGM